MLATALGDDGPDGADARAQIRGQELAAPEIIDLEVTSAWRRSLSDQHRDALALAYLADIPLRRAPHPLLLERCWALRHSLTPSDAAYVALAEMLEVPLLTADRRLARAGGIGCEINVLE